MIIWSVLRNQLVEGCPLKAFDQFFLRLTPDRVERAIFFESAHAVITDTFIQLYWTINGFDHLEQGDFPGFAGQGYPTTRAARGMEQTGN